MPEEKPLENAEDLIDSPESIEPPADKPETLLPCLLWICKFHGYPRTERSLLNGLPMGKRLAPSTGMRALQEVGFVVGDLHRNLYDLAESVLPALVMLKDSSWVILLRQFVDKDGQDWVEFIDPLDPEIKQKEKNLTFAQRYSGRCLLVKRPLLKSTRAGELFKEIKSHWLWGTIWQYRAYYYNCILAAFLANVLTIGGSLFTMNVYDRVIPTQAYVTLWSLAIGVVVAMVMEFVSREIRALLIDVAGKKADIVLGAALFRRALGMRMEYRPTSAGSFAHQMREFETVREFASSATLTVITDIPFVILFVFVIYNISGPLALVPLIVAPLVILVSILVQAPLRSTMNEHLREMSAKQGILVEAVDGMESLRATGSAGYLQKQWEDASILVSQSAMKSRALTSLAMNFAAFVNQFQNVLLVTWGVYLIHAGTMSMGALIGTVMLAGRVVSPLASMVALATRAQAARAALRSLENLMSTPVERDPVRNYLSAPTVAKELKLQSVSFHYPAPSGMPAPEVIRDVSFQIAPGERVGVIGRIGSGKSSLLRVMAGIYQPLAGQVMLDGIDLRQIDPVELHATMGFIGQDARLFYGTLRENIMMSRPSASEDDFMDVCRMLGIDRIAAGHPMGFDLQVGEGGQNLSGGQRQLIILARCLLTQPQMLMLDEPTSAMDTQTEALFIQNLRKASEGKTLVVVTHRMAALELVDKLIVLDSGKLVAIGPKDQIISALSQPATPVAGDRPSVRPAT